jgi:hypothetical protein
MHKHCISPCSPRQPTTSEDNDIIKIKTLRLFVNFYHWTATSTHSSAIVLLLDKFNVRVTFVPDYFCGADIWYGIHFHAKYTLVYFLSLFLDVSTAVQELLRRPKWIKFFKVWIFNLNSRQSSLSHTGGAVPTLSMKKLDFVPRTQVLLDQWRATGEVGPHTEDLFANDNGATFKLQLRCFFLLTSVLLLRNKFIWSLTKSIKG